jgi:hypothetical protein
MLDDVFGRFVVVFTSLILVILLLLTIGFITFHTNHLPHILHSLDPVPGLGPGHSIGSHPMSKSRAVLVSN